MSEAQTAKIRLYVEADLGPDVDLALGARQSHYLATVMRRRPGDAVLLFNGRDGEWRATILDAGRKACRLKIEDRTRPQTTEPDLWLLFAPIKRARLDYTVEKATELGTRVIWPVFTDFTNVDRVNLDRLQANVTEAAEQCRRLTVPEIRPPAKSLDEALGGLPSPCRRLVFDNGEDAAPATSVLASLSREDVPTAIVVGPEGGFSERERAALNGAPDTHLVSLGPRILRADTAVVAALALWQALLGDWT